MKPWIPIVITTWAAVYAAFIAKDITVLVERAIELEKAGQTVVHDLKNSSKGHLLAALENELADLHKFAVRIKGLEANLTRRNSEINTIEEFLLYHENRIDEEVTFINELRHFNSSGSNSTELVEFGEVLVKEAHEVIRRHPGHEQGEVVALKSEVTYVEDLMSEIKTRHPKPARVLIIEETLFRCEKTIKNLISRIRFLYEDTVG